MVNHDQEALWINDRRKVEITSKENVHRITLNTDQYRIIDIESIQDMIQAVAEILGGHDEGVTIIESNGPVFSLGYDASCVRLREMEYFRELLSLSGTLANLMTGSSELFISNIRGPALGIGMEIVLISDLAYSSKDAVFGFPDIKYGMPFLLADPEEHIHGKPWEKKVMAGEIFDAGTAEKLGVISSITEDAGDFENSIANIDIHLLHRYKDMKRRNRNGSIQILSRIYDPARIRLKQLEAFRDSTFSTLNVR
jgi:enoyl-CoA hydratase/carnithine racemase